MHGMHAEQGSRFSCDVTLNFWSFWGWMRVRLISSCKEFKRKDLEFQACARINHMSDEFPQEIAHMNPSDIRVHALWGMSLNEGNASIPCDLCVVIARCFATTKLSGCCCHPWKSKDLCP